jgi:hypothetical protein
VRNLKKRIDVVSSTYDLDRMRAIDSRDGLDRLVEIAGAQGALSRVAVSRHRVYHTSTRLDREDFFASNG